MKKDKLNSSYPDVVLNPIFFPIGDKSSELRSVDVSFNPSPNQEPAEYILNIFSRYKDIILTVYKHFSEITQSERNISVLMNLNGFLKFLQAVKIVEHNNKAERSEKSYHNNFVNSLSYNVINLIFSRFSSCHLSGYNSDSENVTKNNIDKIMYE